MATREEQIRVAILGAAEGARDMNRLGRATEALGGEFAELGRDADKLDRKLDELKSSQRELASEFARTGDADIGRKLRGVNADISTTIAARKALVGDIEETLEEADRASERRAKAEIRRQGEVAKAAEKAAAKAAQAARKAADEHRRDLDRLADRFKHLGVTALTAAKSVARASASVAAVASLSGPAITGLVGIGKAVAAVGKGLATLPPLAAALPALIGGFALVVGTMKSAGPAIGKALTPIGEAFKNIQTRIGAIASKGLPEFARGSVKVNFPAISRAMDSIAGSTNQVLISTGKWINSLSGQQAIRQITEATAAAAKRLEGPISRVAVSFGEMVKRIGGRPIAGAADAMNKLADATIRWMDSIDNDDIDKALQSLSGWGGKLKDTFIAVRDVGRWMAENEDKVKKFSDTVAGLAIVLGVATGNWVAVIAGSASLAINHWDDVKKAFSDTGPIKKAFEDIKNDPNLRGIWDSVKKAWDGAVDSFKKGTDDIGPKVSKMFKEWKEAWDEWAPLIQAWWDGIGKPVFSALGTTVAANLEIFIDFMTRAGKALDLLGEAIKFLWRVASQYLGYIVNAAASAFGWVPGIGPKLQKAAADFNAFRDRVNNALAGINDQEVFVNVRYRETGRAVANSSTFSSGIGGRASGGPIWAGQSYLTGEKGPELITAQRNGFVHNAVETAKMIGGSAGGKIQVEFAVAAGGNSAVAEMLRYLVRVGDLQLKVVNNRVAV